MTGTFVTVALLAAFVFVISEAAHVDWTPSGAASGERETPEVVAVSPHLTGARRWPVPPRRRLALGLVAAVVVPVLVVTVLVPSRADVSVSLALSLQLLGVVMIAALGGLWPGLLAAVAAPMLVNWFLVPPYGTLHIGDRQNEVTLVVFLATAGAVSAFVSISAARAATAERSQLEAETAALAQSDALRTSLLRAVSHDLRTPLASIKAAVSSLRESDVEWSDADRADFLETIESNTDRLTALITDLLDLSKLQAGAVTPAISDTSVDDVVAAALESLDAGDGVRLALPREPIEVRTDPVLLERVVANLVANAIRWSPAARPVEIAATRAGDRVHLTIVDHGPGIDASERRRARQPFQRTADAGPGGVGLGLAIADQMSAVVGADLRLCDTPGGGLTAVIDLPARASS